jgi:putative GTP pyrophosphokinase
MKEKILSDFTSQKKTLDSFCERTINLLSDLLQQEKVTIHHISGRTKDHDSLSKKIDRKLGKYTTLDEITDLVGVRIISYMESDVDVIAKLITKEFLVDSKNSIDKRDLNIDQFGYKSLHLVVNLNASRSALTEYKDYKDLKCEIQIRSILQHAWAEIEHDLGYKGKSAIPDQYKRNFNRLAALLETADIEFDRLKQELNEYESEVGELIKKAPEDVKIDQASLNKFNLENNILQQARDIMSKNTGWTYDLNINSLSGIIERFEFFGMKTIKDIEEALKKDKKLFFVYLDEFTRNFSFASISITVALYYYQHFLAGKTEDISKVIEYQNFAEISIGGKAEKFIEDFIKAKTAANRR